jgi:hypothetical protein
MNNPIFQNESEFQSWCNGILEKLNIHYVHISSKNRYVRRGILDLLCWYHGKAWVIELKMKGEKIKAEQKKEIESFKDHDIPAYVVYTADEFIDVLKRERK